MHTWFSTKSSFNEFLLLALTIPIVHCSKESDEQQHFFVPSEDDRRVVDQTYNNLHLSLSDVRMPIDMDQVFSLETFACDMPILIENRFVLLAYFTEVHCETCFHESAANLRIMKRDFGDRMDFCFVANLEQDRRRRWLQSMMRTSVISCPVYLDPEGASSLPSSLCFYLVDMMDSTAVLRYYPQKGSPRTWTEFREQVGALVNP